MAFRAFITNSLCSVSLRYSKLNFLRDQLSCTFSIFSTLQKEELPFKYVPKEKKSVFQTGDEDLKIGDLSRTLWRYKNCQGVDSTNEIDKKIFSLEFASGRDKLRHLTEETKLRVKRHKYDDSSLEVGIARCTIKIRAMQNHLKINRTDVRSRVSLKETIETRTSKLRRLRAADYKRFEWILKELNIIYQPPSNFREILSRKLTLKELTRKYCEELRKTRLAEYREKLKSQQEQFMKEKLETLKVIIEEEKSLGLEPSIKLTEDMKEHKLPTLPTVEHELVRIAGETQPPTKQDDY